MNNSALGMVHQWQNLFYEKRYSETLLPDIPDFVKLCDAYGWVASVFLSLKSWKKRSLGC